MELCCEAAILVEIHCSRGVGLLVTGTNETESQKTSESSEQKNNIRQNTIR